MVFKIGVEQVVTKQDARDANMRSRLLNMFADLLPSLPYHVFYDESCFPD